MKKILALLMALCMALAMTSCAGKQQDTNKETAADSTGTGTAKTEYTLGMGVEVSTASSDAGKAQVDATYAAVILADGKVAACKIDCAQNKMVVTDGIAVTGTEYKTKYEKGSDYGMKSASGIGKEWFEQADAFAAYVVGKSVDEIKNIAIDDSGKATDADLVAGCTIKAGDLLKAVVKACEDEQSVKFTADSEPALKIAGVTDDSNTKNASEAENGTAAMYTTFAAAATVSDKVSAAIVDEIQPKIAFNTAGEIGDISFKGTKRELKDDYGMKSASGIGKEWFEQAKAFCDFAVGKGAADISGIAVGDDGKTTDTDLLAGCTITVASMVSALAKALG